MEVKVTECDKFFMRGVLTNLGPYDSLCEETVGTHEYLQIPKRQNGGVSVTKSASSYCSTLRKKTSLVSTLLMPFTVILLLGAWAVAKKLRS